MSHHLIIQFLHVALGLNTTGEKFLWQREHSPKKGYFNYETAPYTYKRPLTLR